MTENLRLGIKGRTNMFQAFPVAFALHLMNCHAYLASLSNLLQHTPGRFGCMAEFIDFNIVASRSVVQFLTSYMDINKSMWVRKHFGVFQVGNKEHTPASSPSHAGVCRRVVLLRRHPCC